MTYGIEKTFGFSWKWIMGFDSNLSRPRGFLRSIEKTLEDINVFKRNYEGRLETADDFTRALYEIEQIYIEMSHIDNYAFMPQTTDFSDESFAQIAQAGADFMTKANVALSFLIRLLRLLI